MTYQVKIQIFEGPLDLLLHLIQKNDLDIYDIPISEITKEYLNYLEVLQELNLNVAGEFLVMAATLMQIKAKTLLPVDPSQEVSEGPDPRSELVQKLIEYQKFKQVASLLGSKFENQRDIFYRGTPIFTKDDQTLDLSMAKLLEAFNSILKTADTKVREILVEEIPVEVRIREIIDILESKPYITFKELFQEGSPRKVLIVTFLALLELIRLKQIQVSQPTNFGDIHIQRAQQDLELSALPG
ncbi:MAG: segregation and condensation protein A [Elusimicrobiota bacterium]